MTGGELKGDPDKLIRNAAPFENAGPDDITYAGNAQFLKQLQTARAGAVIVPKGFAGAGGDLIAALAKKIWIKRTRLYRQPFCLRRRCLDRTVYRRSRQCDARCTRNPASECCDWK